MQAAFPWSQNDHLLRNRDQQWAIHRNRTLQRLCNTSAFKHKVCDLWLITIFFFYLILNQWMFERGRCWPNMDLTTFWSWSKFSYTSRHFFKNIFTFIWDRTIFKVFVHNLHNGGWPTPLSLSNGAQIQNATIQGETAVLKLNREEEDTLLLYSTRAL